MYQPRFLDCILGCQSPLARHYQDDSILSRASTYPYWTRLPLSPLFLKVETSSIWKVTTIGRTHFYGRKGHLSQEGEHPKVEPVFLIPWSALYSSSSICATFPSAVSASTSTGPLRTSEPTAAPDTRRAQGRQKMATWRNARNLSIHGTHKPTLGSWDTDYNTTVDGWNPAPPVMYIDPCKKSEKLPTPTGDRRISEPSTLE